MNRRKFIAYTAIVANASVIPGCIGKDERGFFQDESGYINLEKFVSFQVLYLSEYAADSVKHFSTAESAKAFIESKFKKTKSEDEMVKSYYQVRDKELEDDEVQLLINVETGYGYNVAMIEIAALRMLKEGCA